MTDYEYEYSKLPDSTPRMQEPTPSNTWINIKSIFYTIVTLILFLLGLLILPLGILIIGGVLVYIVFRTLFTVRKHND